MWYPPDQMLGGGLRGERAIGALCRLLVSAALAHNGNNTPLAELFCQSVRALGFEKCPPPQDEVVSKTNIAT